VIQWMRCRLVHVYVAPVAALSADDVVISVREGNKAPRRAGIDAATLRRYACAWKDCGRWSSSNHHHSYCKSSVLELFVKLGPVSCRYR